MNSGLNRKEFKRIVFEVIKRKELTYRALEQKLGISYSTFTRIKQEKDISLDSFLILWEWIKEEIEKNYGTSCMCFREITLRY